MFYAYTQVQVLVVPKRLKIFDVKESMNMQNFDSSRTNVLDMSQNLHEL